MKTGINGAVFALLLAFAAPVPLTETLTGQEQESACVVSRPARTARHAPQPREACRVHVEHLPPAPLRLVSAPLVRFSTDWIPPILSRPPPL